MKPYTLNCSLGICVYNEEKNIAKLLQSVNGQKHKNIYIDEIVVIASGTTDKTCEIVRSFQKKDKRIKLQIQKHREGKASAVNLFISCAKTDILVLVGGDLILDANTISSLVKKFVNEEVGMTGARPIPLNNIDRDFFGFAAHLLWDLHHKISLQKPKMGEAIAFRKVFKKIPVLSSVDEANIEPLIRGQGYKVIYVPTAKVYNKAPTNLADFIKQRRRVYNGHLAVKYEQSYEVATMDAFFILKILLAFLKENPKPKFFLQMPLVVILEGISRSLGWWDYHISKKRHTVWDTIESTKKLDL